MKIKIDFFKKKIGIFIKIKMQNYFNASKLFVPIYIISLFTIIHIYPQWQPFNPLYAPILINCYWYRQVIQYNKNELSITQSIILQSWTKIFPSLSPSLISRVHKTLLTFKSGYHDICVKQRRRKNIESTLERECSENKRRVT
jgi:hypothetical protein